MIVFVVEYSVHYESEVGGVHKSRKSAQEELDKLEKDCGIHWNQGQIHERELE